MIDQELLDILVCPETKEALTIADESLVKSLNDKREAGELKNRAGNSVKDEFEAGLVREDGKVLYMIQQNIPIMLIDEAIPLD
jgi:uncharacterized protein YbaR (Trm112 family)